MLRYRDDILEICPSFEAIDKIYSAWLNSILLAPHPINPKFGNFLAHESKKQGIPPLQVHLYFKALTARYSNPNSPNLVQYRDYYQTILKST